MMATPRPGGQVRTRGKMLKRLPVGPCGPQGSTMHAQAAGDGRITRIMLVLSATPAEFAVPDTYNMRTYNTRNVHV